MFACDFGYVFSRETSCVSGNLISGTCDRGAPCQITSLPELTEPNDCPLASAGEELLSGESCQPLCITPAVPGATIGPIRCDDGDVIFPSPDTCEPCLPLGAACTASIQCCNEEVCGADGTCGTQ
jgi:hypothetical protein